MNPGGERQTLPAAQAGHPVARERAFELHCQGLRSAAIAAQVGAKERTVRRWIQEALARKAPRAGDPQQRRLALAVARQHQIAAEAWTAFERALATAAPDKPRALPIAAHYRDTAHHAQAQAAHLQGLRLAPSGERLPPRKAAVPPPAPTAAVAAARGVSDGTIGEPATERYRRPPASSAPFGLPYDPAWRCTRDES